MDENTLKRINPDTGVHFKHGDIRNDGYIFKCYVTTKPVKKNGFYQELWLSPTTFNSEKGKQAEREKLWRKQNRSKIKLLNDKYKKTKRGHLTTYLERCKSRARKANLPFDLDLDYLESIATDSCPVFKTVFDWGCCKGHRGRETPSLDKIVPEKGYVKGNVVFISDFANRIKQDATADEILIVGNWLKGI